jgi:hypothetical protein
MGLEGGACVGAVDAKAAVDKSRRKARVKDRIMRTFGNEQYFNKN